MNELLFIEELKKLKIDVSEEQLALLQKYYDLLIEWNERINLTTITAKEEVYLKHFYDSLTLIKVIDINNIQTLCDVGTGAGFPGLVLKIFFPKLKIILLDSLQKRITFLDNVIKELKLDNISTIHMRAEDYVKDHRNEYDIVVSRAVARLPILTELCLPLVKTNGYFIAMKANAEEEIIESLNGLKILNSEVSQIEKFYLPLEKSIRTLIKIKKLENINNKYPRKFEEIKKKPL